MRKNAYLGLPLLAILALSVSGFAQAPAAAPPQESPDITAYRTITAEKDPAKHADLDDKFLADTRPAFIDSQYREPVFRLMIQKYSQLQAWQKLIDTADKMGQLLPKASPTAKGEAYAGAMTAAFNGLKSVPKGLAYAELLLGVDPANLNALIIYANTMVENLPTDAAAKEAALTKVVTYANKVIATPPPAGVTPAQWQPYLAQMHADIGFVGLIRKNYEASMKDYDESLKLNPKIDTSWYRNGLSQKLGPTLAANTLVADNQKKDTELVDKIKGMNLNLALPADKAKFDEINPELEATRKKGEELDAALDTELDKAIDSFASAVALAGPVEKPARQELENLYKTRNGGKLDGLQELIDKKKAALKQ
jgi:tetratricopeptide (TPR) repeat protein